MLNKKFLNFSFSIVNNCTTNLIFLHYALDNKFWSFKVIPGFWISLHLPTYITTITNIVLVILTCAHDIQPSGCGLLSLGLPSKSVLSSFLGWHLFPPTSTIGFRSPGPWGHGIKLWLALSSVVHLQCQFPIG